MAAVAAAARAATAARSAAAKTAAGGLRRMYSIFADLDLKRTPDLPPKAEPSTKLFVAGLNKETTSERLREAFSKFGQVLDAHVVTDRVSGSSRGFGFVQYDTLEESEAGKKGMDNKFLDEWVLLVDYAKPRSPPTAVRENRQYSPSFQGVSHNNGIGGDPQTPPSYTSQPSYPPPPSYQSQSSYYSSSSNEHNSYKNAAPMTPQPPPFQDSTLNHGMASNHQSPPAYPSQPSYPPPSYQSQPPYSSPPSNELNSYKNVGPVNPHTPPFQDGSLNSEMTGNPQSPSYQAQSSHQSLPSSEHKSYNNASPLNGQSPPFYHRDANPVAPTYLHNRYNNQVPANPFQSTPSYQHDSYNNTSPMNPQSSPSYQPAPAPSYLHTGYNNKAPSNTFQSPPSYQQNSNSSGPVDLQSPCAYEHNTYFNTVPEDSQSPPSNQYGNYDYQRHEDSEAVASYQYGR